MNAPASIQMIYYLDVLSSWCWYAEPAIRRLRETFGERIDYEWRIAWLAGGGPLNYSPEQLAWYYRRSGSISGTQLNPAWLSSRACGSRWPDIAALAAKELGISDDRVRLALAKTCLVDGQRIDGPDEAARAAAPAGGLDVARLRATMEGPTMVAGLQAWDVEFAALGATQRPTVVFKSPIEDFTVLSGCFRYEPMEAAVRSMLADLDGYRAFAAASEPLPA